ncbi:PREDICTED: 85/88 kDa calcium-independent phospholipase A2-like, partial [Rhagoletis zephyria]|uniref:85/88 kDa calcium-independent phospholipase A2-like n=1 Tax=Rhagoletis zephyria TaxID=28612 RepID=UPI000811988B
MMNWLFGNARSAQPIVLFENPFSVIDLENESEEHCKNRSEVEHSGLVHLCSNMNAASNGVTFYEVLFSTQRGSSYGFLLYHSISRKDAHSIYQSAKSAINTLHQWIPSHRLQLYEQLQAIMGCLKVNRHWNSAHIAASLSPTYDGYFTSEGITAEVLNAQANPDKYTPLHLAIKKENLSTVRLILALGPDLNLVNVRKHSVLHYAAMATKEIASLVLNQEDMFGRILWTDNKGSTALHLACVGQKYDIVIEFLKFGLTVRMLTLSPPSSRHGSGIRRSSSSRTSLDKSPRMQKIVHFSEQDLEDIDFQDISVAGTPLHWTKHKRLMVKLLRYSFPLNSRNFTGDTALAVASKRLRLKCVIALLCAGANVNATNVFGNTPLHLSVRENDIAVSQTLIVFDADLNAENNNHQSVRHVAAKSSTSEAILYLISALGAKRCPPPGGDREACENGCSSTGDFEGNVNEKLFGIEKKYDLLFKEFLFSDILQEKERRTSEQMVAEKGVNMLCLDGGGIKGLISLQMLKEVEKQLKHPLNAYFKWFAGTSTGSFICTFLAMGKSIDEIRGIYFRFKEKVLTGDKPYSSEALESVIKEVAGTKMQMKDIMKKHGKYLIVPTVIANRRPMKLHKFRSYPSVVEIMAESGNKHLIDQLLPDHDKDLHNYRKYESRNMHVWEACRASGAAPIYFRAYGNFIDGGLIANNPTMEAMTEFEMTNAALRAVGKGDQCQSLDLVLSIGTGKGPLEVSEMVDIEKIYSLSTVPKYITMVVNLVYEACQTEQHVTERVEAFCKAAKVPYFRINSFISDLMELDEPQDSRIINCLWETKRFMYYRRDQVK